jgi:hypothetical protein
VLSSRTWGVGGGAAHTEVGGAQENRTDRIFFAYTCRADECLSTRVPAGHERVATSCIPAGAFVRTCITPRCQACVCTLSKRRDITSKATGGKCWPYGSPSRWLQASACARSEASHGPLLQP